MKLSHFNLSRVVNASCLTLMLSGLCQTVSAGPTSTDQNYSVSVFAGPQAGLTNPDSITVFSGTIFVEYANGTQPDGTGGSSTIVQFSPAGVVLHTYQVPGKSDGMKTNPFDRMIWCLRNEDANPAVTLIDPVTHTQKNYKYAAPPLHGGGYDDIIFLNGMIFISASNPNLQPPTKNAPNGQNIYPSILKATIDGDQIVLSPVLYGNASLIDITSGKKVVAQQSDPDSLKVDPSGNLVLDSQQDGDLIFLNGPGFPNQVGYRLHLSNGSPTQVTVDDTVFPTQASGTIYVVDTAANTVYAVTSNVFPPNSAFSCSDGTGVLGRVNLSTGTFTPIVTGMQSPHGALFVPTLPEVRIKEATTPVPANGLTGAFIVARTGDLTQALTVVLGITDSSASDPESSSKLMNVVIPAGNDSVMVMVPLDSAKDFKEDHSIQHVIVSIQPDANYNLQPNLLNTGVQEVNLPAH